MAVSFGQRRALGKRYAIDPAYLLESQRLDKLMDQQAEYARIDEQRRQFDEQQKSQEKMAAEAGTGQMVSSITGMASLPLTMYGLGMFGKSAPAITTGSTATGASAAGGAATGTGTAGASTAGTTGSVITASTPYTAPSLTGATASIATPAVTDAGITAAASGSTTAGASAGTTGTLASLGGVGGAATVGLAAGAGGLAGGELGQVVGDAIGIGGENEQATVGGALGGALAGAAATSWSGPGAVVGAVIGAAVGFLSCFIEGTPVKMADGSVRYIETIDLCDEVMDGGFVTGVGKVLSNDIYNYEGVTVSGSHAVLEDGVWLRIRDSEKSVKVDMGTVPVYIVNNENHRLIIGGITFADYGEVTDSEDWTQQERLDYLNNQMGVGIEYSQVQEASLSAVS